MVGWGCSLHPRASELEQGDFATLSFFFLSLFSRRNGTARFPPVRSPTQLSGRRPLLPSTSDRLLCCRRRCRNPFNLYCHSPTVHYCRCSSSAVLQRGCRAVEPRRRFNEQTYFQRIPGFGKKGKCHLPFLGKSDLNICDDERAVPTPRQIHTQFTQAHVGL